MAAFSRTSPEVRGYVRRPEAADALRELGAKVAVGDIEDVETLTTVMAGAHTVCHLVGGLDLPDDQAYERSNVGSVRSVLEAAGGRPVAEVARLVRTTRRSVYYWIESYQAGRHPVIAREVEMHVVPKTLPARNPHFADVGQDGF